MERPDHGLSERRSQEWQASDPYGEPNAEDDSADIPNHNSDDDPDGGPPADGGDGGDGDGGSVGSSSDAELRLLTFLRLLERTGARLDVTGV